jgi:hypothetical protein
VSSLIKVVLKRDDYDFIQNYAPAFKIEVVAAPVLITEKEVTYEFHEEEDYDDFESGLNFTIVHDGLDNQEHVNKVGKRLYKIYDNLDVYKE